MSNIVTHRAPNGVRILAERVEHVESVAVGLWCRTGSANELPQESGLTHLIEHMLFKGTERRTSKQIAEEVEGRGGNMNAFTDRENTCYYCRLLKDDLEVGIDVLCDMVLNSKFDQKDLELERSVVLEEIKRSLDEPSDYVHDLHLERLWKGHALARSVLGDPELVGGFTREQIRAYMDRRYAGENLLIAVSGKVDPDRLIPMVESRLASVSAELEPFASAKPEFTPTRHKLEREVEQVHFCIGTSTVPLLDDRLQTSIVLEGVLGGGMSSRLFQEIREKRGLAYAIGSYALHYSQAGALTVYGGTSADKWPEVQRIVGEQFDDIATNGPNEDELERIKRNVTGSMVLSLESMSSRMVRMAKNELIFGRQIPLEESMQKIRDVSAEAVRTLAQEILDTERLAVTSIEPAA